LIVFCMVLARALRPFASCTIGDECLALAPSSGEYSPSEVGASDPYLPPRRTSMHRLVKTISQPARLAMCAAAIHLIFCFYTMLQEFLTTHTFDAHIFKFPVFLIAVNRTAGAAVGLLIIKLQGLSAMDPQMKLTTWPAITNFVAQVAQYQAMFMVPFPVHILMKSAKVLPAMFLGRVLGNRAYSLLDYIEGFVISALVALFAYHVQHEREDSSSLFSLDDAPPGHLVLGAVVMVLYVVMDALTSNLEDYVYQRTNLDPSQQMLGVELGSGFLAWATVVAIGEARAAIAFLLVHDSAWQYIALLAFASAFGTYACTLTVRLFGPAVLTLLMVSRQIFSLILSMVFFQHQVDTLNALCLGTVSLLIFSASLRRTTAATTAAIPGEILAGAAAEQGGRAALEK